MDHEDVGRLWNGNAEAWTTLSRAGHDVYRDAFNTPAFLEMLPDVTGLAVWTSAAARDTTPGRSRWPGRE